MNLDCNLLILDYLVHHCYGKTAKAFIENIKALDQFAYLPSQTKHCKLNEYSIIYLINACLIAEILERGYTYIYKQSAEMLLISYIVNIEWALLNARKSK